MTSTRTPEKTNTLAIVSFVSSFVVSIAAIVTGHLALKQIRQTGEGGRGLAIAGLIIGYVSVAVSLLAVAYLVITASVLANAAREVEAPITTSIDSPTATPVRTPEPSIPPASLSESRTWEATFTLNGVPVTADLFGAEAPQAVASFNSLTDAGFFNGSACHRLTTSGIYVLQCGDPTGSGTGGPEYRFGPIENAPTSATYQRGHLAMARLGNDAASMGSQFFIIYKDSMIPNDGVGGYTVFGKIRSGLESVDAIASAGVLDGSADGPPTAAAVIDSISVK